MNIGGYISELLYEHDCVIVPDFGGFVGNYSGARIDSTQHKLNPPYKQISFNKSLKRNDGLLCNHVAGKENMAYDSAVQSVENYREELQRNLNEGRRAEVNHVGVLFHDQENRLRFEPDQSVNYLTDAFGLTTFHTTAIQRPTTEQKIEQHIKQKVMKQPVDQLPVRQEPARKKWRAVPYAIAALPVIAYLVWLPMQTDILKQNGSFTTADLNPFKEKVCTVYQHRGALAPVMEPVEYTNALSPLTVPETESVTHLSFFSPGEEGYNPDKLIAIKVREVEAALPVTTYVETATVMSLRFHVIGGCFSILSNAEGLVRRLRGKGYKASIVDQHKGLHRVSIEGFATRKEAKKALRDVKAGEQPDAWVLKK